MAGVARAAREAKVKLTTGYCWRLHPAAVALKRIVRSGILGSIVGGEGRCAAGRLQRYTDGNASWMLQREISGGGPMINLGVHWIDLFRWMLEDEVVEVSGRNVKVSGEFDVEDNSFAHLRFSQGASRGTAHSGPTMSTPARSFSAISPAIDSAVPLRTMSILLVPPMRASFSPASFLASAAGTFESK